MVYDVVIIGAATSGAYFAKKMAKKGYKVKMLEKLSEEKLGTRMDIFHVSQSDFKKFDMPRVKEGDKEWAFEFTDNHFSSPTSKYTVSTTAETVGLHMHEYVALMVKNAVDAGAEIEYSASFKDFLFDKGVISGVTYETQDGIKELHARVVIDCSGSGAAARRALPENYGVETFKLSDEDMFYGTLTENVYSEGYLIMLNNRFLPIMDETNTVSVLGDVRWLVLDNLSADLNLAYNHCATTKLAQPVYRPTFEGKLRVKYDFNEKLAFNASVLYQNGRYGMEECDVSVLNLYDFNSVVKLKDVIDIAFGADYKINDQMAVFAKIANLAKCKYQLFYNYPVTGIQLFAGLKMTF